MICFRLKGNLVSRVTRRIPGLENKKSNPHFTSDDTGVWNLVTNRIWRNRCAVDVFLRLNLMRFSGETSYHASDSILEFTVRSGVYERIDAAVRELQYNAERFTFVNSKHKKVYLRILTVLASGRKETDVELVRKCSCDI